MNLDTQPWVDHQQPTSLSSGLSKSSKKVSKMRRSKSPVVNGNGTAHSNGVAHGPAASVAPPKENIFLFIPNLIGYSRIVLAIASLYYMPLHPRTCSFLYSLSCILDAVDGLAARHFEQSTKFGAVLDMVTDRCTTSCLLVFLASAFPRWAIVFQGLISLDLASHYIHMYATLSMGEQGQSHKNVDAKRSWALKMYYSNNKILFTMCAFNELFFIALYLLSFSSPLLSPQLLQPTGQVSSMQPGTPAAPSLIWSAPWSAGAMEMARANKMDSFWPWVLACVSSPVMIGKQYLNILQLNAACQWLAEGDLNDRRKKGLPRKPKSK